MRLDSTKLMYFGVNELEVSVNDGIISGNEQQKVYIQPFACRCSRIIVHLVSTVLKRISYQPRNKHLN